MAEILEVFAQNKGKQYFHFREERRMELIKLVEVEESL